MSVAAMIEGQPKEVVRSYTPISSDENLGYFDLLIKSYPQGNISLHMSKLKLGETLKVRGPKGAMVYTPGLVRRFGMIAGGTGITPMLQIIRAIIRGRPKNGGNDTTEVDLIFANVSVEDILLKDDLDALAKEDPGFRVYHVLNNPPEKWDGGVGFCSADMIKVRTRPQPSRAECNEANRLQGSTPRTRERHEASPLRTSTDGQRHEESHRVPGLRKAPSREQTRGSSLLLLSAVSSEQVSCGPDVHTLSLGHKMFSIDRLGHSGRYQQSWNANPIRALHIISVEYRSRICTSPNALPVLEGEQRRYITHDG